MAQSSGRAIAEPMDEGHATVEPTPAGPPRKGTPVLARMIPLPAEGVSPHATRPELVMLWRIDDGP